MLENQCILSLAREAKDLRVKVAGIEKANASRKASAAKKRENIIWSLRRDVLLRPELSWRKSKSCRNEALLFWMNLINGPAMLQLSLQSPFEVLLKLKKPLK